MDVIRIKVSEFLDRRITIGDIVQSQSSYNSYVANLDELKTMLSHHGLTYVPNGSKVDVLKPGQWCIKSVDYEKLISLDAKYLCFHPNETNIAMLMKLTL